MDMKMTDMQAGGGDKMAKMMEMMTHMRAMMDEMMPMMQEMMGETPDEAMRRGYAKGKGPQAGM